MATYCVTVSESGDWGDAADRFKAPAPANNRLLEKIATGHRLVRIIRWEKGKPKEVARFERHLKRPAQRKPIVSAS